MNIDGYWLKESFCSRTNRSSHTRYHRLQVESVLNKKLLHPTTVTVVAWLSLFIMAKIQTDWLKENEFIMPYLIWFTIYLTLPIIHKFKILYSLWSQYIANIATAILVYSAMFSLMAALFIDYSFPFEQLHFVFLIAIHIYLFMVQQAIREQKEKLI